MVIQIQKAKRESVWLKMLLQGASNSGKTYSGLMVAEGIFEKAGGAGVCMINCEASRGVYYADKIDYSIINLEPPYTAQKYIEAIDAAIAADFKVILIDGISQEWTWLNEYHDSLGGNSFQAWARCKPIHKRFMDKILTCPAHIICTARGKQEYSIEEKNGKKEIIKLGVGADQSKQLSFEFTVSLLLNANHYWEVDKDNTGVFEGQPSGILTKEDGINLYNWANVGNQPPKPMTSTMSERVVPEEDAPVDELATIKSEIIELCKTLGGTKNEQLMETLANFVPSKNPNAIRSVEKAKDCLTALKGVRPIE